jgi:threonine dehydrogenase-like Zn-dependent dehydrogenase
MQALVWDGAAAAVGERAQPAARDDLAILRVRVAGVCSTDLEIVKGYMGFRGILGHEFVGEVVSGPEDWIGEWKGARAVGEINFACARCPSCAQGQGRHSPHRRVLGILDADGAMAQYVALPTANLHRVPNALADDEAVFTEPVAAACEILEQLPLGPEQRCVVLGDGKLGLLIAQVLQGSGARVLAVGKHAEKLGLLSRLGIETALLGEWCAGAAAERHGTDVVVEATGSPAGFRLALEAVRPRGTVVLKSTIAEAPSLDLSPIVIDEIQVLGSRCGSFAPALTALAAGRVQVRELIHDRFPLAQGTRALERAAEPGVLKVLVDCA